MNNLVKGYFFKKLSKQLAYTFSSDNRKPTRKDLDKYDIVVVGANLGGICSRHIDESCKGKFSIMVVFDQSLNQIYPIRCIYEQQQCSKTDYMPNAKLAVSMFNAHSDLIGIKQFLPDQNKIVLRNGRVIEYNSLVIGMGMNEDIEAIKGFEDAWKDPDHPVFAAKDHSTWRAFMHKYPKWHYNFNSGDAYFCIPPYPFRGEVETYNFFISTDLWKQYKRHGKQHPDANLTIMNANDKFVQFQPQVDKFIKDKLAKENVKVEYGMNLIGIDQNKYKATFQNLKTGKKVVRDYNNLYSLIPCKPHQSLLDAGLASKESNGLLDVNINTLQHKKYKNIFGIGDCCNLPTTKTFWAGFYQINVVRNNLLRQIQGQTLNARYDGFTKVPLFTSQGTLCYLAHYYNSVPSWQNLWQPYGIIASLRYKYWCSQQKKKFLDYYLHKTWGPPCHKFPQRFKELPQEMEAKEQEQFQNKFKVVKKSVSEQTTETTAQA